MKKKELKARIEALEARVAELEMRLYQPYNPDYTGYPPPGVWVDRSPPFNPNSTDWTFYPPAGATITHTSAYPCKN